MKIQDIMHKGVTSVGPETPVSQVAMKMRDLDIGALPVIDGGQLVGIITDRDVTVRAVANGKDVSALAARQVMSSNVVCCRAGDEVHQALQAMEKAQVRRMPVTDGGRELVGMISLGDIVQDHRPDLTEEVTRAVAAHHA